MTVRLSKLYGVYNPSMAMNAQARPAIPVVMVAVRRLTEPPESEIIAAAQVLSDAFKHDAVVRSLIGHDSLMLPFEIAMVRDGLLGGGEIYVAEDETTGEIVGCAHWFGPGTNMFFTEEQQKQIQGPLFELLGTETVNWWSTSFTPYYTQMTDLAFGPDTKFNIWHLQNIGVKHSHQSKGVGAALIRAVQEKIDPQGLPMCLESSSPRSRAFYQRMGFEVKGSTVIPSPLGDCSFWAMLRPATPATTTAA